MNSKVTDPIYRVILSMIFLSLIVIGFASSGCSTPKAAAILTDADHGPLPANYEKLVKDYFEPRLKDPFSAQYKFQVPFKGYTRGAPITGGKINNIGWVVLVHVKAKNSYGVTPVGNYIAFC